MESNSRPYPDMEYKLQERLERVEEKVTGLVVRGIGQLKEEIAEIRKSNQLIQDTVRGLKDTPELFERNLTFSEALAALKKGKKVRLSHWGQKAFLALQKPDEQSKMKLPYIYSACGEMVVPWTAEQMELLSEEWEIVR